MIRDHGTGFTSINARKITWGLQNHHVTFLRQSSHHPYTWSTGGTGDSYDKSMGHGDGKNNGGYHTKTFLPL